MQNAAFLSSVDLILRGATCGLVLLIAAALLRDHGRLIAARLGALFALGTAAFSICSMSGLHAYMGWWAIPIMALATGNNVVFWVFAAALFDDSFRFRPWHAGIWLAVVLLGLAQGPAVGAVLALSALGFAALAIAQTISSWRADLVEGRRRLRLFIVGASAAYIGLTALSQLLGLFQSTPELVSVIAACGLLAIAATVAWSLLCITGDQSLFLSQPAAGLAPLPIVPPQSRPAMTDPGPADRGLVAALERLMTVDRAYRQDGLTIGALAQRMGLPEYRLRRLINQALGYRNFNSFLNDYRLREAKAALADPDQAAVPVLTIALDAGFNSLGPFNRAFKTDTGLTPSEYRRLNAGGNPSPPADFGIGQPVSQSTSPRSNSA
jgi:AraC-like DNA-binding protein